tara:strand:- start:171 stop:365 length:195 start_codon:yes stop_codon:yes gene_type:complete
MKDREEILNPQPMFADRETLMEAFDYAKSIIERGDKSEQIYNMTALMVIWNTIANKYKPLIRKK